MTTAHHTPLDVIADTRWIGNHGIGRFAREVLARLPYRAVEAAEGVKLPGKVSPPLDPLRLTRALRTPACRSADVFFSPGYVPPLRCPIPFVFTLHDVIHLTDRGEATFAKRVYYRRIVAPAARRAAAVLTVSEVSKRRVVEQLGLDPGKVVVVGNGVSAAFTPDGPAHRLARPYILYVGARRPHKRWELILDMLADDRLRGRVTAVFAGRGDAALTKATAARGLDETDAMPTGVLTDDHLAAWYRGTAALVLPSSDEGFGLPQIEAAACDTAVVATDIPAVREVMGGAAVTVAPDAPPTVWADTIARLIEDPTRPADHAADARHRVAGFTWPVVADRIMQTLAAATGRPAAHPEIAQAVAG